MGARGRYVHYSTISMQIVTKSLQVHAVRYVRFVLWDLARLLDAGRSGRKRYGRMHSICAANRSDSILLPEHCRSRTSVNIGKVLFLLFLVVPIVEIYLLIQVGSVIGALPTIALVVLTAVIGSAMLRHQGISVLRRAQQNIDQGILPARELLDGVFLVVGGALLLTPGFVTDAIGFMCLLPVSRAWMISRAMRRLQDGQARVAQAGWSQNRDTGSRSTTIEGEWRREGD